jgi:hypothetical protein
LAEAEAQMAASSPVRDEASPAKSGEAAPLTGGIAAWAVSPPRRRPDG